MSYFHRYLKDIKLSGLLYLHRITDNRVASPTPLRHLPMITELCGKNSFQNVILATTMWDEIDEETGAARELELESKHWRPMLDRNSTTSRFNGTRGSAFTLIDPLVNTANKRNLDLLEKEMQDMRKKLPETSAGQELFSTMEKLVRQREDLLSQIRNELKRADCDRIRLNLESLQEEHLKLQINLESTIKEMRRLKLPPGQRLMNMTDSFSKFSFRVLKSVVSKVSKDKRSRRQEFNNLCISSSFDSILSHRFRCRQIILAIDWPPTSNLRLESKGWAHRTRVKPVAEYHRLESISHFKASFPITYSIFSHRF